jgi:hypothetical protein
MTVLAETHQHPATPAAGPHRSEPVVRRRWTAFVDWFWAGAQVEPLVPPLRGYPIERH